MLLRLYSGRARGLFAEMEEAADLVPEFGEGLIVDAVVGHGYIVSRYYRTDYLSHSKPFEAFTIVCSGSPARLH